MRIVIGFRQRFRVTGLLVSSKHLSAGQSLESAVPERNGAHTPGRTHGRVEWRGRWNVCLRRRRRRWRPRPQCQRPPWWWNAPRHSTAFLRPESASWLPLFRPPGAERMEFGQAGGVFRRIPRLLPGRFDDVWWDPMTWHNWVNFVETWDHETVCETSCHRSTYLAPPFFVLFSYSLVWTCRDEGLFAAHVPTWWLQNVGAFLFGAAVVALQSELRVEYIWDRAIRFDLSPWKLMLPSLLKWHELYN